MIFTRGADTGKDLPYEDLGEQFLKAKPANLRSGLMMVVMSQGCSDADNLPLKCCWTLVICAVSKPLCSEK